MQKDFHYYATYCAALFAGYSHAESAEICYSAQMVDCCSRTLLEKLKAPKAAATTQLQLELANAGTDLYGLESGLLFIFCPMISTQISAVPPGSTGINIV